MDRELLGNLMGEFEAPETVDSRKSEIMLELNEGFSNIIAKQEKLQKDMSAIEKKNLELQKTNSHYANRIATQSLDMVERKEQQKAQEKKERTLSDALKGL
ncbi:head morphogenesis protein [Bacillus phage Thornton]|uniref:Head morphogenesis protein n=1 Tax=Bacillus phage Thornton TaxID=2795746 RepID=A0A7T7K8W0_9CAUD|nr:head scaffolding protein [Bacillus phage Thornton]QQM15018.1 head morphogenesis protein [Bacillus phage Thornton]